MADKKIYSIQINGITESVNAVDALNKQLEALESRMSKLEGKNIKISGGGSLKEEIAAQKELNQLKKEEAAQQRLAADAYANTMKGMKQNLADLKTVINSTDLGDSSGINRMTKDASKLTEKLKEMEAAYGQFGRNVGNYSSAFDKIRVAVGKSVREYDNYRKAIKELKQERFQLSQTLGQESEQYKEIDKAVKQLESDYNDLNKSSKFMDNLLDTMQGFTALASVGQGFSALFGFDSDEIQKSIQKLVALQNVLKGIETIQLQMQKREGIGLLFYDGNKAIDKFVAKITGAKVGINGLTASSRAATVAVRGLSIALKGIGVGLLLAVIPKILDGFTNITKEMNSAEKQTSRLDEALNSLNKSYKDRNELLSSSYMKGGLSDEQYLEKMYMNQSNYLNEQIYLLRERARLMNEQNGFGGFFSLDFFDSGTVGGNFTGEKMNGSKTVESYSFIADLIPMLKVTVENIQDVEREFNNCNEAIKENKDYLTKWGSGLMDWVGSLFTTVSDTERVLIGLGNIRLNEFVGSFAEVNQKFNDGKISAEEYAKELSKLKNELNSSDVLHSVIVNLDKYIPDEKVREAVNNIINEIIRLDDAFNMTSPSQIHHWNQVRIDGMKEGTAKIKAQIASDEAYEIAQYGKTQEQIDLIHKKYNRKRLDEIKKYNEQAKSKAKQHAKEIESVENELNSLRIENMEEGLAKQLAQLEEERRQKLQKAKDNGIKVGELTLEINKLYDKKIKLAKEEWAYNVEQVYINMWNKIYQLNHKNAELNFESQLKLIKSNYEKLQDIAAKYSNGVGEEYSNKGFGIEKTVKSKKKVGSTDAKDYAYKILIEKDEAYTKRLREEYSTRTSDRKKYYQEIENLTIKQLNEEYAIEEQKASEAMNNELRNLQNSYKAQDHELETHLKKGLIDKNQFKEASERLEKERAENEAQIQIKYQRESSEREKQHNEKILEAKQETNNAVFNNYKQIMEKLENVDSAEIVKNGLGFMNIKGTRRRNKQLIDMYRQLAVDMESEIKKLESKLSSDKLTKKQREQIQALINEYRNLQATIGTTLIKINEDSNKAVEEFIGELNTYFQAVGNTLQGILQAVWDYQDYEFEKEQEKLDKWNEELDKKLDEQEEIVQRHKEAIDSIEEELATSRGDRRQHLIDQLNAEMAAQREAEAEEKRIQKQKEIAEKKQEQLEKKRREEEYKRNVMQAFISWHLGVANALATQPFMPLGIAMGALATTLGAVQYALVKSQKPYAKGGQLDGGVAQGKRHRDGGIPVLGGRASIEGGEFITNRQTTASNVDLLDYINSKHRKLNIDDFIDFYSTAPKKSIRTMRTKFEDGGYLPTLPNSLDIKDQLQNIVVNQDNRPIYVSVVDINNKQDDVRRVQTLAGL